MRSLSRSISHENSPSNFLAHSPRIEYALKRAGYVDGDEMRVNADWDKFGRDLAMLGADVLAPVIGSCPYLASHPPKKQVLDGGQLVWKACGPSGGSAVEEILLSVRTVRNNVFHGGKFPDGPVAEPLRDEHLIGIAWPCCVPYSLCRDCRTGLPGSVLPKRELSP